MMKSKKILIILIAIIIIFVVAFFLISKLNSKDANVEIAEIKQYNYFVLKQNDKYGIMDTKGNILVKPEYDEIKVPNPEKAVFICYQGETSKVLNEKSEQILEKYENVEPIQLKNIASDLMYEKSVLKFQKNGKYGLVDFNEKEIVSPNYDNIESLPYREGELLVKQNEKYGLINIKGKKLINTEFDEIKSDDYYTEENKYNHSGYIVSNKTQEGYRYGYINYNLKRILPNEYNEITRVDEEYLICAKNGQYGVNKNKEEIIKNEYQSIRYDTNNKLFVVEKTGKYGVANTEGKVIVPIQYNQIDITGIYLYAQNEQGTTVYESSGKQASIDPSISIVNTDNEKYKIKIDSRDGTKYGVIGKNDKQIIEQKYNYIEYLHDNYFIVSDENGKLGIIDDNDEIKVAIKNNSLQKIKGTDLVQTTILEGNENTVIYDKQIKEICKMPKATVEIVNDHIKIYNQNEIKYFNKFGEQATANEVYPDNKLFITIKDNKYGYVDSQGKTVVKCEYDNAYEFNKYGFAAVKKNGKWGAINDKGEIVVEPIYELNEQDKTDFVSKYYRIVYGFGEFYYTDEK